MAKAGKRFKTIERRVGDLEMAEAVRSEVIDSLDMHCQDTERKLQVTRRRRVRTRAGVR